MAQTCDLIVIGSGQGGVPLAVEFAKAGQSVYLFESGKLGGTCINTGCTPSKTFLASAHAAQRARNAEKLGVFAEVTLDFRAAMERVGRNVLDWRSGVESKLEKAGVHLVRARARFSGERTVAGGDVELSAPIVVIDTGSMPAVPPIPGLAQTPYLTSDTFFDLRDLPKTAVVIGAGDIGVELGQGLARCGCLVTIVEPADRVLGHEEADVSEVLQKALEADGVDVVCGTNVQSVRRENETTIVELSNGKTIQCDALLVATGRKANTADLNVDASGVKLTDRGFVDADEYLRTACDGVYAIGDVAGQPQFTHVAWEDYRRVASTIRGTPRKRDDRVLAYAVFTYPQVGRAGLTVEAARKRGIRARAETLPVSQIARASEWGDEEGFYRMVVDESDGKIIGATLVGYEAGEIVHVLLAHMEAGSTWHTLDNSVHIHPTFAEGLPTLARLFAS